MKAEDLRVFDNQPLTPYLATAICEGFCEGENANARDVLTAWAYMGKTGLHNSLQGWFGRTMEQMTGAGLFDEEYNLSDYAEETLASHGY